MSTDIQKTVTTLRAWREAGKRGLITGPSSAVVKNLLAVTDDVLKLWEPKKKP